MDKSYDHNFINIWISIFRFMKNRRKNWTSSLYEFSATVFKKNWNAEVCNFQTEYTDTAFHHFNNSDSSVHFLLQNI